MIFDFSTPINTDIYILLRIFTPKRYVRSLRVRRLHQSFSIKLHKGDPIHINKKAQNFQHQMVGQETEDNRVTNYYLLCSHELIEREKSKPI